MLKERTHNNGRLSATKLACGYIQVASVFNPKNIRQEIELYKRHGTYHVRRFTEYNVKDSPSIVVRLWDSYNTLAEAQKRFTEFKQV